MCVSDTDKEIAQLRRELDEDLRRPYEQRMAHGEFVAKVGHLNGLRLRQHDSQMPRSLNRGPCVS